MTIPAKQERLQKLLVEYRMMQGSVETLQQRLQILNTAITDLRVASISLKALKEEKLGAPILVPTGGGIFVNATLRDPEKVIVGIGADVSVEMTIESAVSNVSERLDELENASQSVQQQLEQILIQMQVHQNNLNRLAAELQGEPTGV